MNWEIVGALGELLGGLAVVLSVLYLAHQVRETRMQAMAAGQRELLHTAHLYMPIATTPGATKDWRRALNSYETMDPDAQARFTHMMHPHINHAEAVFHMHRQGLMDDPTYERWMAGIVSILTTEGGKQWWSHVRTMFGPEYVAELEKIRDSSSTNYRIVEPWHFYADDGERSGQ